MATVNTTAEKGWAVRASVMTLLVMMMIAMSLLAGWNNGKDGTSSLMNGDAYQERRLHVQLGFKETVEVKKETVGGKKEDDKKKKEEKKAVVQPAVPKKKKIEDKPGRRTYQPRGQPMSDQDKKDLIKKWGSWTLKDKKERPQEDYYQKYPNRDIPRTKFPPNAWQIDKDYLGKFLTEGLALVDRAQKAILLEYGQEDSAKMFGITKYTSLANVTDNLNLGGKRNKGQWQDGGWTTEKSWDGLTRRLLHAVMTQDNFIFAMGGHSAAAGHGNHFTQSYTLQVQWILEAVFARLGVRHEARNFGNGGLGTLHNGLAAGSVYGPDVDVLMWDSGMTEREDEAKDMMARQQLLGGVKVPVLWSLAAGVSKVLNLNADVDVGMPGNGLDGITEGISVKQIGKMPWAAQYVRCNGELHKTCRENEYKGTCWIDREDFTPNTTQQAQPGGRAGWHPGNRIHQVTGRVLAYTLLEALKEALTMWKDAPNYELSDDAWHVTAHYENIRTKLAALEPDVGSCNKYAEKDLEFGCTHPVKARTMFQPRAYPPWTSILNIMPPAQAAMIDEPAAITYEPPDVFNPNLHPPPGAVDVLNIVEAGIDFSSVLDPDYTTSFYPKPTFKKKPQVPLGKGISGTGIKCNQDRCDGSVDSWCNRCANSNCLLYGHNDARTGLHFNSYSGWLVMNIPDLKNGYIVFKFETWHFPEEVPKTNGWTSINNEEEDQTRRLSPPNHHQAQRELKRSPAPRCKDFTFDYAIDGKVTSLNLEQFDAKIFKAQRVVETITLLKDPKYTGGKEKEVEVAIRITGCKLDTVFSLNHIYWS